MTVRSMTKIFLISGVGFLLSAIPIAKAETITAEKNLLVNCDTEKNEYIPYEELVVVDLRKYLTDSAFSAEDLSKQIYYEFAFIKNRKFSPFNAIYTSGKLYMQQCDQKDISSRVSAENDKGMFIIGVTEDIGVEFQSRVTDNNLVTFVEADLINGNSGLKIENKRECGSFCKNIRPAEKSWKDRAYSIAIEKVVAKEKVDQKDYLEVSIFVKNDGKNPIYGDSVAPLYVETNEVKSAFYHQSWIAGNRPQKNTGVLQAGQKAELKFTLNSPLVPGSYEQKFRFSIGNVPLKVDEVKVAFTVNDNGLKLAIIRPKDNVPFARVRAGESLSAEELFKLDPGDTVIILKDNGAWLNILTKNGRSGWIYRPNIRFLN